MTDVTTVPQEEGSDAQVAAVAAPKGCVTRVCLAMVRFEHRVLHCLMTTQGELECGLAVIVLITILFVHSLAGELAGPVAIFLRNIAGFALEAGKDVEEL